VELEVAEGITEHSSRVALKGVFQNFGDVVACWVPPIDRRHQDRASVRFGNAQSAEAAKAACDQGQVYLQGMVLKVDWRHGGGRRVGNSDLGATDIATETNQARALLDAPRSRRSRSRDGRRRRSRSRDRRDRSKDRRRSRSRKRDRDEKPAGGMDQSMPALPAPPPAAPMPAFPEFMGVPALPPVVDVAAQIAAAMPDPEEERRKQEELEKARAQRAKQLKRGPGVAALVQGALKKVQLMPPSKKVEDARAEAQKKAETKPAWNVIDEEETKAQQEARRKKEEEAAKAEAARKKEKEAQEAKARERAQQETLEKREQARKDAEEAEKRLEAMQKKEAETREERIKASVVAAKKQQAERERAAQKAAAASDSLYSDMPQSGLQSDAVLEEAAKQREQREKNAKLSNLPPEDKTKVVFLDIDGVLRPARAGGFDILSVDAESATRVDTSDFFPSAVKALRHIMERTGAIVVLSSEWRRSEALRDSLGEFFEKNRMRTFTSTTNTKHELDSKASADPLRSFAERRVKEISQWLSENEALATGGWAVLDDINLAIMDEAKKKDMKVMSPHLVQTWPLCGLTMGNAKTAVRILNGEMINKVVVERPTAPIVGEGAGGAKK